MYNLNDEMIKHMYRKLKKRVKYEDLKNKPDLFSGDYNDLIDKPEALPANGGNSDTVNNYYPKTNTQPNSIPVRDKYGILNPTSRHFYICLTKQLSSTATIYYKLFSLQTTGYNNTIILDIFANSSFYRKVFIEINSGHTIRNVKMTPTKDISNANNADNGIIYVVKTDTYNFDVYLEHKYIMQYVGYLVNGYIAYSNSSCYLTIFTNSDYQIVTSLPEGSVKATEIIYNS